MNKKQLNKFRMYESVDLVFDTHSELVGTMVDLLEAQKRLKAGQATINQNRQVQEVDNTGLTKNKSGLRGSLIQMILLFSAGLKAYSIAVKNVDLKTRADYTASELNGSPDSILFDIGTLVYGMAIPLKSELAKYFLGEAEYKEIGRLLAEYKMAIPKRRVATSETKVSTGNIDNVFNNQDKLLKEEVDVLMHLFEVSQPDFYNAYKNARAIVNYTGRGKGAVTETPVSENAAALN